MACSSCQVKGAANNILHFISPLKGIHITTILNRCTKAMDVTGLCCLPQAPGGCHWSFAVSSSLVLFILGKK
jgi:hypothetical protein